jgi:hypothetical protein
MSTKVQGHRILEEDLVQHGCLHVLPANLARVLHPSYALIHSWCTSNGLWGVIWMHFIARALAFSETNEDL